MKRTRKQPQTMDIALRGAAAGVIGGAIISLAQREVLSRISGGPLHRAQWDDLAGRGLERMGIEVHGRDRIAAGVTTQLLYSAALGACYAVLREELKESRAGALFVDAALTFAASLVFPDEPMPKRRGRRLALRKVLAKRANPAMSFNRATSMMLQVLTR